MDARYVEECTRRLEGSLLQKANVAEVELHIRPYARALEETQQAIRGLKGGLGVHDERLKGLDAMQQSLGESMATHRQGVDETIVKFESFKTSITRAASAEHETMKKQFETTHHAVRQLQDKNNVDNEQIHKQFERAEAEIRQLQDKNAKPDQQVNTLSEKVVRLAHELQRLQVRVQDNEHAHHQRELQVDQLLARLTGQVEGLQGTVSQGPPQDPNGPPRVPQTTVNQVQQAVLDAQQALLVAQQAQDASTAAQRLSQQTHTDVQQLRVEIQEVRGAGAAISTEVQRSVEVARAAHATSAAAQSAAQSTFDQMVVVQSNIQPVDQKIKQLESANGTWGIVPETGTLSGVQDMLGQANAMLAELKSAAERTRRSAADTTHRSMEERLRAVENNLRSGPDTALFTTHLEGVPRDVHGVLTQVKTHADRVADLESVCEGHAGFAQDQRRAVDDLVARCQGMHDDMRTRTRPESHSSSPPPPPPPPQPTGAGYGGGHGYREGRGDGNGNDPGDHPGGHWRPPAAATFPQAHQYVESMRKEDDLCQLAPYFDGPWFIPSRAVDPPPNGQRKKIRPTGIGEGFAFHEVRPFMVAEMELQALPHEQSGARMPMAFFKKDGHHMIDASTVQLLQTEYAMPVWKDLEDQEEREKWEKQWSQWVGVRLEVVDGRTLVGCLLVSIPKAIHDHFFERTMREDLDLFTLWKEIFRYGRRFRNIYRTEPVWKGLRPEGSVGPMEWCNWFTAWLEKGSQVIGGVTKMQAHSQLLLVLTQYCEVREDMPWRRIGEKLFDDPAQRGFGYNYLELYVMVMEFLTQTEDARRAKRHFLGAAHSVSAVSRHCFTCGSPDHIKLDCPRNRRPEQAGQSDQKRVCHNYGKPGHFARDPRAKEIAMLSLRWTASGCGMPQTKVSQSIT